MTELSNAFAALGPVAAGVVVAVLVSGAVRLRAGEYVVLVGRISAAVDRLPFFRQRGLLVQVVRAVKLGDILCDDDAFGVLPWTTAYAIAGIDRRRALSRRRAQVRMPRAAPRARRRGERLAMLVRAREAAEVGTLP